MNRELMIPIHYGALDLADDLARLRDAELCRRRLVRPDRPGEDGPIDRPEGSLCGGHDPRGRLS